MSFEPWSGGAVDGMALLLHKGLARQGFHRLAVELSDEPLSNYRRGRVYRLASGDSLTADGERATLPCSISPSIANSGSATSCGYKSTMSAAGGRVRDRANIIQKKTGRPVQFEITEQTRAAIRA